MKILRTKKWPWLAIGSLKWCCLLLGMIAGAYLADFTKSHVWFFAVAAVLLMIKPWITYWGRGE